MGRGANRQIFLREFDIIPLGEFPEPRMRQILLIALMLGWVGGCEGGPPPAASAAAPTNSQVVPLPAQAPVSPAAPAVVAPPEGAQWTIYCDSFTGPNHVEIADQAKAALTTETNLGNWHIVHEADQSLLYYGYYKDIKDPQARADKRAVDSIAGDGGTRRFRACMFVPLTSPDPVAPPEWDLRNTPASMYWSLQIAAFRGTADRKERAVEAVREARAEGIEAYYYHGETISSVCIGAWPREAVRQQESADAHTASPDDTPFVSPFPVPDGAKPLTDENGKPLTIIAPKVVIDDPSLQKTMDTYPEMADNGYVSQQKDANGKLIPASSFLVHIPHREGLVTGNDADGAPAPQPAAPTISPADNQDGSLGKLRTIGDH
jgi:hypothetical protein